MEELYVFRTGDAQVTHCCNTCFAIKDGDEYFMVGAGGGNGILRILENMDVDLHHIHDILVTYKHTDHILGIVRMVYMVAAAMEKGKYKGKLQTYCHQGLADTISATCCLIIQSKFYKMIGSRTFLVSVEDGETVRILDHDVTFFDILSTEARQSGFTAILKNGRRFICAGDEPYNTECRPYVEGNDRLFRKAFYLYRDREIFGSHEKHHSTVKEAYKLAEDLSTPNLVLWHAGDKHLAECKTSYTTEGREYYRGNLLVPGGGEVLPP